MDWHEARDRAIRTWRGIADSIGTTDMLDLLVEINAVFGLCEKAREEAAGEAPTCAYCAFYQQFGGCREASARMSERVVEKDWDGLRALVSRFVADLETLRLPPRERQSGPARWS